MKCSKRISRRGSRNVRFLTVKNLSSANKKENTWGVNTKSCEKSIVTEADTCITESSEIEQSCDFSEWLDCSVLAFLTSCWRNWVAENVLPKIVNIKISDIKKTLNKRAMWEDFCILNHKSSMFLRGMPKFMSNYLIIIKQTT